VTPGAIIAESTFLNAHSHWCAAHFGRPIMPRMESAACRAGCAVCHVPRRPDAPRTADSGRSRHWRARAPRRSHQNYPGRIPSTASFLSQFPECGYLFADDHILSLSFACASLRQAWRWAIALPSAVNYGRPVIVKSHAHPQIPWTECSVFHALHAPNAALTGRKRLWSIQTLHPAARVVAGRGAAHGRFVRTGGYGVWSASGGRACARDWGDVVSDADDGGLFIISNPLTSCLEHTPRTGFRIRTRLRHPHTHLACAHEPGCEHTTTPKRAGFGARSGLISARGVGAHHASYPPESTTRPRAGGCPAASTAEAPIIH
jgi:hypothetical protein